MRGNVGVVRPGLWSFELWTAAAATGADLLWPTRSDVILPVIEVLPDGSYLSQISASNDRKRRDPVTVRVTEYRLQGRSKRSTGLVTTILDPQAASAAELAALYAERWEIASAFGKWKTYQRGGMWCCGRSRLTGWSRRSGASVGALRAPRPDERRRSSSGVGF